MIHLGAARLGYSDDADYRVWMESLTGKRSAKECTLEELAALVSTLRACKALESPKLKRMKGGRGDNDRPTDAQWQAATQACHRLGMSGCDDPRFAAFAQRNCKVSHPRFLTREAMRGLIAALVAWANNLETRGAGE
jgi:hypothetical protein